MSFKVKARILDESGAFNKIRLPEIDGKDTQKERLVVQKYDLSTWYDYYNAYGNLDPFIAIGNPKGVVLIKAHDEKSLDYGVFSDFSVERDDNGMLALYAICTIYESNKEGQRIKGELDEKKTINLSPTIVPKDYQIKENKEYTDYDGGAVYDLYIQKILLCEVSEVASPNFVHSGFDKDDILENGKKRINEKELIFKNSFTINHTNIMSQQDDGLAKVELTPEQLQNMIKAAASSALEEFQKKSEVLKNSTSSEDEPKGKEEDDLKNSEDEDEDDKMENKCSNSDQEDEAVKNTSTEYKEEDKELKNKLNKSEELLKNAAQMQEYIDKMVEKKLKNHMTKNEAVSPKNIIPAQQSVKITEFNHKEVLKNSMTSVGFDIKKANSVGVSNEKLENSILKMAEEKGVTQAGMDCLKELISFSRMDGHATDPRFHQALRNSLTTGALPAVIAGMNDTQKFVNPEFVDLFEIFDAKEPGEGREVALTYASAYQSFAWGQPLKTATGKEIRIGEKILAMGYKQLIKSQRLTAHYMGAAPEVPQSDQIISAVHSFCPVFKLGASIMTNHELEKLDFYGFTNNAYAVVPQAMQEAKNKALLRSLNLNKYDLTPAYTDAEFGSYGADLGTTMSHIYYTNSVAGPNSSNGGFYQRPLFLTDAQVVAGQPFAGHKANFFKQNPTLPFLLGLSQQMKRATYFDFLQNNILFTNPFGKAKLKVILPMSQLDKFSNFVSTVDHSGWNNAYAPVNSAGLAQQGLFGNDITSPDDLKKIFAFGGNLEIHFYDYAALAQEDAYKFNRTWYAYIEHPQFPHLYHSDIPEMSLRGEHHPYGIEHKYVFIDYHSFGFRNPYAFFKFEANEDLVDYPSNSPMQK